MRSSMSVKDVEPIRLKSGELNTDLIRLLCSCYTVVVWREQGMFVYELREKQPGSRL